MSELMANLDLKNIALLQKAKHVGKSADAYSETSPDPFDIDIKTIEIKPEPSKKLEPTKTCTILCLNTTTCNSVCC